MNRQTLVLKETVLGREHPELLASMSNLAGVLGRQGKHGEAEAMDRDPVRKSMRWVSHCLWGGSANHSYVSPTLYYG
jgi:hypothetical protein